MKAYKLFKDWERERLEDELTRFEQEQESVVVLHMNSVVDGDGDIVTVVLVSYETGDQPPHSSGAS